MTVQEIQDAIKQLSSTEIEELTEWLAQLQYEAWDREIEADFKMGRFDAIIQEVKGEYAAGLTKPM